MPTGPFAATPTMSPALAVWNRHPGTIATPHLQTDLVGARDRNPDLELGQVAADGPLVFGDQGVVGAGLAEHLERHGSGRRTAPPSDHSAAGWNGIRVAARHRELRPHSRAAGKAGPSRRRRLPNRHRAGSRGRERDAQRSGDPQGRPYAAQIGHPIPLPGCGSRRAYPWQMDASTKRRRPRWSRTGWTSSRQRKSGRQRTFRRLAGHAAGPVRGDGRRAHGSFAGETI